MKMKKTLIAVLLIGFVLVSGGFAQWNDSGKFNTWTFSTFSRAANYDQPIFLKSVRAAKNKGYDRLVFEFTGGLPRYLIEYVKSGSFENTAETFTKVGGKAFLDVNLQTLPYPEDEHAKDAEIPKGNQHLPVFNEIKEIEWFEGVRDFGIGLNAKKKFRVQELTNPYRLVIDFKR
jgi:hypothetical protein